MSERMRFILDGDDRLSPVLNRAGDSSARLHRRLNDDMNGNSRAVTGFTRDADGRLRDLRGRFLSVADAQRAMAGGLPDLTRRLGDVRSAGGDTAASMGGSGGGLGGALMSVAAVAGLSLLPALGALVPILAGVALAAGTLKLGFAGVGDALALAGKDQKKYHESLKKMGPEQRGFTKALVEAKKEFSGIGRDVQKAMLPGFTKAVKEAGPVVKILGRGMTELGGAFGKAAEGAGRLFKDSGFQKDLRTNLDLGRRFIGDMLSGLPKLGTSFLSFGAASKPTLTAISGGIRDVLGRGLPGMFDGLKVGIEGSSKFLTGFFNMINSLLPAIGRFSGEVARALGPLFGEMLTSVGVRGAGALDTLGQVVKGLTPVFKDLGYGLKATTDLLRIIGPTVKDTAAAIVGSLLPSFSEVDKAKGPLQRLSDAVRNNKGAIQEAARQGANAFLTLVGAGVSAAPLLIKAFRMASIGILTAMDGIISGAAHAFGWIPGLGGKLKAANKAFDHFKSGYIGGLDSAQRAADSFASATGRKLAAGKLKLNINNWQSQIEMAKAKLKTVPPSKQAALRATIGDLQAKVRQAKGELASLHDKTVTVRINGVRTGVKASEYYSQGPHRARGGPAPRFAAGGIPSGLLNGAGTGISDSIPMWWASTGEYIVNARSTAKYRSLLEAINSDSFGSGRGMSGAGGAVAQGLASGMTSAGGGVHQAARTMAAEVTAGIKAELEIASPSRKTKALAHDIGKGLIVGLTGSRDKIKSVSKDLAHDIWAAFSGSKDNRLVAMVNRQTKRLLDAAKKRDSIAATIKRAKDFAESTRVGAKKSAGLSTLFDSEEDVTAGGITARLQNRLSKMKQFSAYIKALAKRGLNHTMLREILEMGPEQGYAYASALAGADKATFASINKTQYAVNDQAKKLGRSGADALYDSGKNASKGFLAGLKSQEKAVKAYMVKLAKAMRNALREALGIRSPATKLIPDGVNTARGVAVGVLRGLPYVDDAMQAVAGRMVGRMPGIGTVGGRPAVAGGGGGTTVITLNVEVRPGADAEAVWREIHRGLVGLKRHNGGGDLGLA